MAPKLVALVILGLLSWASTSTAFAQGASETAARVHDERASELFANSDFAGALLEMEAAQRLLPATTRVYNIAACHERLGHLSEALVYFQRFVELDDAPEERRQSARQHIASLTERLAAAEPVESPEETSATAEQPAEPPVEIAPATPTPLEQPEPARQRRRLNRATFWALLGITAASTVAFAITGGLAASTHDDYTNLRVGEANSAELQDRGDRLTFATDILIGLSAVGAIATLVVGFLTDWNHNDESSSSAVSVSISPAAAAALTLSGRF